MPAFEVGLVAPVAQEFFDALTREFRVYPTPADFSPSLTAVITDGGHGASSALIESLPHLRLIALNGVGTDAIDLAAAARRGIAVTTTPGVLSVDVAELAIGLLLDVFRHISRADRFVRDGQWGKSALPLGRRLHGAKVGIIGMGQIGRAIASGLTGLGALVAYTSRRPSAAEYEFFDDPSSLARAVEVLIVAAPGGAATRGLVNRAVIDALGRDGVIVNVARGSIIDESAMIEALMEGRLAGAGLDVFEDEPRVPSALLALPNVVLTPHQGSATPSARGAMADLVVANLRAHFAGAPLVTPLDLSRWR